MHNTPFLILSITFFIPGSCLHIHQVGFGIRIVLSKETNDFFDFLSIRIGNASGCPLHLLQPHLRIITGLLPAHFRGQNVLSYAVVQRAQVVAVHEDPLLRLVLQERLDHGQRRLHVPGLSDKVHPFEPSREAVLKAVDHGF